MEIKLVKIEQISGDKASVYTIWIKERNKKLFDVFLEENKNDFLDELKDIVQRLKVIGNKTGAREQFFKLNEGKPGDGVCALYDTPDKNLRLYCIRFGKLIIVVGGGGHKPKQMRSLQESEKLTKENYFLRKISEIITQKIKDGDITFSDDYMSFEGDLTFNISDDEYST